MIFSVTPNPSPLEINAFLQLIIDALEGYDKGIKMINQNKAICTNPNGDVDLDALMAIFVKNHDEHSLDILYSDWMALRQRNKEPIQDFLVRFNDLREDLLEQKFVVPEFNAWVKFRNVIVFAHKIREKPEIANIKDAVAAISKMENSNIRKNGNGNPDPTGTSVQFL